MGEKTGIAWTDLPHAADCDGCDEVSDSIISAEQARGQVAQCDQLLRRRVEWDTIHTRDERRYAATVVVLHERVAAVEAERDAALAHAEELTRALRATQRERDALWDAVLDTKALHVTCGEGER